MTPAFLFVFFFHFSFQHDCILYGELLAFRAR